MLKILKIYSSLLLIVLFIGTIGCKKSIFDINSTNPNAQSVVDPGSMLSGALANTANLVVGGNANFAGLYMGYWALSAEAPPSVEEVTYQTGTDYYSGNWNFGYQILKNFDYSPSIAAYPDSLFYQGIAMIMKAFIYQRIVDIYNNAPYYQDLKGNIIKFPTYDSARDIYTRLINQLDSGITIMQTAPQVDQNANAHDIMFGGDRAKWVKFANTIKLKMALNLTEYSGRAPLIQKALNGLRPADFLGSGEDAGINPGYNNNNPNPAGFGPRACSYAVNYMFNTNDIIRLYLIYDRNSFGVVVGRQFGSNIQANQYDQYISGTWPAVYSNQSSPAFILTACESLLMQAEALQRGYISGGEETVASLYQAGVVASFSLLTDPNAAADAVTYLAGTPDPNATQLSTIIMQEWVSLNPFDPVQSWNNWRRLGIPTDLPVSAYPSNTATHIPYRLLYPTSEYLYNTENVDAQGTINNMTSKIFWMP